MAVTSYEHWLQWVEWYIANGWELVPVARGGKNPIRRDWPNVTTTLEEFKQNYRGCNLAVRTTRLTVADIDQRDLLPTVCKYLGATDCISQTPKKGYHLFFRGCSEGGNRVRVGKQNLDIRSGRGGCAIVEPSFVGTGGRYSWLRCGTPAAWDDRRLREFADWAGEPVSKPAKATPAITAEQPVGDMQRRARAYIARIHSVAGQGGDTACFRAACALVQKFGLDKQTAIRELALWNETNAEPAWPNERLIYKVNQAWELKNG